MVKKIRLSDPLNFLIGIIAALILGMAAHSTLGHYCAKEENKKDWICKFFNYSLKINKLLKR